MVAAIALHLLVASMASAASSCSETIERTRVTRISHTVAQAIRELVDHQHADSAWVFLDSNNDEPIASNEIVASEADEECMMLPLWMLDLPPPLAA